MLSVDNSIFADWITGHMFFMNNNIEDFILMHFRQKLANFGELFF